MAKDARKDSCIGGHLGLGALTAKFRSLMQRRKVERKGGNDAVRPQTGDIEIELSLAQLLLRVVPKRAPGSVLGRRI